MAFLLSNQDAIAAELLRSSNYLHVEDTDPVNGIPHGNLDSVGMMLTVSLPVFALCCFQALQCCDEGAYLLANQQMDKCQSKEGAQKALQDIERFLESSSAYLNYDPQALHYDFESVLTSELKVSNPSCSLLHKLKVRSACIAVLSAL